VSVRIFGTNSSGQVFSEKAAKVTPVQSNARITAAAEQSTLTSEEHLTSPGAAPKAPCSRSGYVLTFE